MSEDKTAVCRAALPNGCPIDCRALMLQEQSREDLRLDCLRLALQRQGARDSRELLVIAEEYYDWVIAESGGAEAESLAWPARKEALSARERLTLGAKKAPAEAKPRTRARQTRVKGGG